MTPVCVSTEVLDQGIKPWRTKTVDDDDDDNDDDRYVR